ncbi:MAG: acyl carrier protein [Candidatus Eisenbacteria bacterium]|nr:acyl carrier protein [Candidatus Eisenbacteria bacterium]
MRAFLGRYLHESSLADGDDLFASGRMNSLFAMQLVLFLEKEFRVRIENRDLDLANFRSIDAMAALIEKKLAVFGTAPDWAARPEREN